jgi:predicted flap endonuclease-1-like 5' DNA nuclease
MSILFFVVAFIACCATGAAGAWVMRRHINRDQSVAESEDPRDTKIRDLLAQMKVARDTVEREKSAAKNATEHLELAHERIVELTGKLRSLDDKCVTTQSSLNEAGNEVELLRNQMSVASSQLDSLRQRNQELELELSVSGEREMLDAGETSEPEDDDELETMFKDDVDNAEPSLIQSLSTELERWKKHCHVLGHELKQQRDRDNAGEVISRPQNVPLDSIDELTDIRGIGNVLVRKLHSLGIYRYDTLVEMSADDMERASTLIPDFEARMNRDRWCDQARALHDIKYHQAETA